MAYDRERVAVAYRRALAMLRHLDAVADEADALLADHHRFYLDKLRRRALAYVLGCQALRRAN